MIDDEADFGNITDAPEKLHTAVKFRPKARGKPRKPSVPSRSLAPNPTVETTDERLGGVSQDNLTGELTINQEITSLTFLGSETISDATAYGGVLDTPSDDALTVPLGPLSNPDVTLASTTGGVSAVDRVSQNEDLNDDLSEVATHQENLVVSDTQASSTHSSDKTIDDLADFGGLVDTHDEEERIAKFKPKIQVKLSKAASKPREMNQNVVASAVDAVSQNKEDGNSQTGCDDEQVQAPRHQERVDSQASLGTDSNTVDNFANLDSILEKTVQEEMASKSTAKFQHTVGRKRGKGKSVSFVLPDAFERVSPTDTNSEMSNISHLRNDTGTEENLSNSPQQTAQKHCITEEQHPNDPNYTDRESQHHEREPSGHAVEQQPKLDVGKIESSMKLRSRKKFQKIGVSEHSADDNFDENYVEPSAAEQDNDSDGEYTAGGKKKVSRKSREKDINKEPLRGSKRTSKDSTQKSKSEVSSRGRKRALKDTLREVTEQPEKKLTHRIRQKRAKEVKTLLEKPDHEIDRMKLSVMHLRLLQEARERIKSKTIPSGPSSNQSSQFGDTDDFDFYGENYDNDRTENHVLENATKLNYHSYMNKQTRAKWSKSDTDLFYQGLQQFGSDFAMIQQLFPDKTRDQVRQKFKAEEKKHPMQVHDAILNRSRDNLYLKQVIKQLNIEDLQRDINSTYKQEATSNEGDPGNENTLDDFIDEEVDNGSNWSDKEQGSEVNEGEHVSASADDNLDVFDWY